MRALPLLLFITVLTSCNSTAPTGLPGGATLIREGGGSLSVTAPDNGTLYVRDLRADQIVWEGQVSKGQRVDVEPAAGRVALDGRALTSMPVRPDATFQIFFKATGKRGYHPAYNP